MVNLAFVTAGSGRCTPTWGGRIADDDPAIVERIRRLRAAGADVRVSFGGAASPELAQACESVSALAAAYSAVVDRYRLTRMDLDVEGAALTDSAVVRRRNQALREVQAAAHRRGAPVELSFTLPADASGLTAPAQDLLRDSLAVGVDVGTVNVMTMNFGSRSGDLATQAISAAVGAERFVRALWRGGSEAAAWGRIAITPMIGVNDVASDVFRLADAQRLMTFAGRRRLAWISFWSVNRDRPCPAGTPTATASPVCSGVRQRAGDFTAAFAGDAPAPRASATG